MMKRDFDYVAMDDYRADMDEQSTLAAGIISRLKDEAAQARYQLWLIINAAGGSLPFYESDVINNSPNECKLELSWQPADDKFTVSAISSRIIAIEGETNDPNA